MTERFRFGILICLFLISGVLIAGCSDQSPAGTTTPVPTTAPAVKYAAGDIIAPASPSSAQNLFVIIKYDQSTDQYTRQMIYKNADGSWGHFVNNRTETVARTLVEKVYAVKISQVKISSIAIVTPTPLTTVTITPSGYSPAISGISPTRGGTDATVGITITGNNFQSGATVKLMRAGDTPIQATSVTVSSSTKIDCTFKLTGAEKGGYNIRVTNPDGQSDTLVGGFTIGESAPLITSITPDNGIYNDTVNLVITGQYFKDPAKVSVSKGSDQLETFNVQWIDATKILCVLEIPSGTPTGDWNVTVFNIADEQSGTWNHPFEVNAA
ncbi:MAG TPA: IPT/TIG domain-containing protein [Methanoregula sp.]|nr:IPT/TIG domain-containing protein [Methanoregula sp.]